MFKCVYFSIKELVSPKVYKKRGEKCWELFDIPALKGIDLMREIFGACVINDWSWKGLFKNSGLRTSFSSYFRMFSQHKFGRGFDMKFSDYTSWEIRKDLVDNWESKYKAMFAKIGIYSITLEEGKKINWVHIDFRNAKEGVNVFYV